MLDAPDNEDSTFGLSMVTCESPVLVLQPSLLTSTEEVMEDP